MKNQCWSHELRLILLNGFICYVGVVAATWIQYYHSGMVERLPRLSTIGAGLLFSTAIVFCLNARRSPNRFGFALIRTVAHVLFGAAAPPALLLIGLLAAPHGMKALPRIGVPLCVLLAAATVGLGLLRWVVVPLKNPKPH